MVEKSIILILSREDIIWIFNESKTAGAVFIEDSEELKESEDGFFYPDYQHNNATDMTKEEFFN